MPLVATTLTFLGGFLADTALDFVKDQFKGAAQQRLDGLRAVLGQRKIPVNHDVQKAVRRCHLLAGSEVARWGRRQWRFEKGVNEDAYYEADAAYRLIIDYLDDELARFRRSDYVPDELVVSEPLYLNFTQPADETVPVTVQRIRQDVLDALNEELETHLHGLKYPHKLPHEFRRAVADGWTDGNRTWTVFGVMCDFFHELVKTDEQLRAILQTQWLADVKANVDHLTALLDQLGNDFVATYGKIPTYFGEILERLNPQPQLRYDFRAGTHADFTFRSRYVPFMGRDTEQQRLRDFCDDPAPLGWCLLTGPGGSGKSRMALEICTELAQQRTVYAGFMQSDHIGGFPWTTWQPTCPTLIVIDYVALAHESVLKVLRTLKDRAETGKLAFTVKLLLLERDTRDTWYEQVERQIGTGQIPAPFSGDPMPLPALDVAFLWRIIVYMVGQKEQPLPDYKQVLPKLIEIDALGRPLFAVFVGYALAEGAEMIEWDKVQLLQYLLDRHIENIWLPAAANNKQRLHQHLNLLAVTTMAGGLSQDQVDQLLDKAYKWLPGDDLDLHLYRLISPGTPDKPRYAPLEPDIFGEYFVLWQLKKEGDFPRTERDKAQLSRNEAWALNYELASRFTYRLFQDFEHLPYATVANPQAPLMPLGFFAQNPFGTDVEQEPLLWRAELLFSVTLVCGEKQIFAQATELYGELRQLSLDQPLDEVLIIQATAAFSFITHLSRANEFTQATELYEELRQLALDKPLDEVVIQQARAVFNLITDLCKATEFSQATKFYEELRQLAPDHSLDEVVIQQAKAAFNLISYLCKANEVIQAIKFYQELRHLTVDKPLNEIVIWQAEAAFNLINRSGKNQEFTQAKEFYEELRQLAIDKPLDEVIIEQAKAAYYLIHDLGTAQEFTQAAELYEELRQFALDNPISKVMIRQARAAVNLISHLGHANEFTKAIELYKELQQPTFDTPFAAPSLDEVMIQQAKAAFNLIYDLGTVQQFTHAIELYQSLRRLAFNAPWLDEVFIRQVNATVNLISNLVKLQLFDEVLTFFLDELSSLIEQKQHPVVMLGASKAIHVILLNEGSQLNNGPRQQLEDAFLRLLKTYHEKTIWHEDPNYALLIHTAKSIEANRQP